MKRAVLLFIVYRRYYELYQNLEVNLRTFMDECGYRPEVVLLWSDPCESEKSILEHLVKTNIVQHLVSRDVNKCQGNISYHCAKDIEQGLSFIFDKYGKGVYSIVHCADIKVKPGVYSDINGRMNENRDAYLVHLNNVVVKKNIWHTNFFAVTSNKDYWPPVLEDKQPDILERCWGRRLVAQNLSNFYAWNNFGDKTFVHTHETEQKTLQFTVALLTEKEEQWQSLPQDLTLKKRKWWSILMDKIFRMWKSV